MTNAAGGVAGHLVELDVGDVKSDAATAQSVVRKLAGDGVVAMIYYDTATEGSVGAYLASQNIPVIGANGFNTEDWGKLPTFFNLHTTAPYTVTSQVVAAKAVGDNNIGVMVCAEVAACKQAAPAYQGEAAKLGLNYEGLVTVSASAPNYTAECLSLMAKNTDFMILAVTTSVSTRIMHDCIQQGYKGVFSFSSTAFDPKYLVAGSAAGAKTVDVLHAFPWWVDAPGPNQYRAAMTKYAPGQYQGAPVETAIWAALTYFATAVGTQTGTVTRTSVFNDIYSLKSEDLGGLLPQPVTFASGQPAPPVTCFWPVTYTVGDVNPALIQTSYPSGNGQTGVMKSICVPPAS
jgi:branched-chain amino acid transport system substrate-binding protein